MTITANPDVKRWNDRYADGMAADDGIFEPRGEPELVACRHLLDARGLALDAACGRGENAAYLCRLGYDVVAADCAFNGLVQCLGYVEKNAMNVFPLVCDFRRCQFPAESFAFISVIRFLDRSRFEDYCAWLSPGGLLFYKTFNSEFLKINPTFNPDYVVEKTELAAAFAGIEILVSAENDSGSSFLLARK